MSKRSVACERAVIAAAKKWWENHRPVRFNQDQHLENPAINTCGLHEANLASAVAAQVREERKP